MSYTLRRVIEQGYVGIDYYRVSPLGTAGLMREILLGTTAAQLKSSQTNHPTTSLRLATALEQLIFTESDPSTEQPTEVSPGQDAEDLDSLVTSGIKAWAELLQGDVPIRTLTVFTERRGPSEYVTPSGLVVLDPELAVNPNAQEFLGYQANSEEIEAISRLGRHVTNLIVRDEDSLPGNYL